MKRESISTIDPDKKSQYADDLVGKVIITINPRYFRPAEVDSLIGDASKAKEKLNWEPTISFTQMVDEMVAHLDKAKRFLLLDKAKRFLVLKEKFKKGFSKDGVELSDKWACITRKEGFVVIDKNANV